MIVRMACHWGTEFPNCSRKLYQNGAFIFVGRELRGLAQAGHRGADVVDFA